MKIIRSFFLIINLRTLFAISLSVVSVWLCLKFGIKAEFPLYLISIAIVFPIVFSIDSAYKRREHALQFYADLKGHAMSLYFAVRDWVDPKGHQEAAWVKAELETIFREMSALFMKPPAEAKKIETDVFHRLSGLSRRVLAYKQLGMEGGEVSRLHQYVSKMLVSYNIVRNVFFYRTPITLRAYSKIFIYFFPVLYGPYAASTYNDYTHGIAYFFAVLYSIILVSLDNLQEHLENPFDQVGEDDIDFEVDALVKAME
jgi:predicted membrane chloride channel (bestrophin family)